MHTFTNNLFHKLGELIDERAYVIMDSNFIGVKGVADKMYRHFLNMPPEQTEEEKLYASIRDAEIQWKLAEGRFNEATDPDLIDFATYDIMATKSRYEYLIKTAKKQMGLL